MKKLNNYITIGLLLNGIFLISNRFNLLPDFFQGFCVGLGIVLIFFGMYTQKQKANNIRKYKKDLLNNALGK